MLPVREYDAAPNEAQVESGHPAPSARADGARGRGPRALGHGLRQRRVVDLLRPRARGRVRAGSHAPGVPVRRPHLRRDRHHLHRGDGDVPRGGRLVVVRAPGVQRGRGLRGGLGPDAQLHHHDRHLGVLRAPLPRGVLGATQLQPLGHHRGDRRGGAARGAEHRRDQGGRQAQPGPGGAGPGDAGAAGDRGAVRAVLPHDPLGQHRLGRGTHLDQCGDRRDPRDDRLYRHRDHLEHGRGGAGTRAHHPRLHPRHRDHRAGDVRPHPHGGPLRAAGDPAARRHLLH